LFILRLLKRFLLGAAAVYFVFAPKLSLAASLSDCGELSRRAEIYLHAKYGLAETLMEFEPINICKQQNALNSPGQRSFEKALDITIRNILTDARDAESPLRLLLESEQLESEQLESEQLESGAGASSLSDRLLSLMNHKNSRISLVGENSYDLPERGEPLRKNWVFAIEIFGLGDHFFWGIVPKDSDLRPYNYGFN